MNIEDVAKQHHGIPSKSMDLPKKAGYDDVEISDSEGKTEDEKARKKEEKTARKKKEKKKSKGSTEKRKTEGSQEKKRSEKQRILAETIQDKERDDGPQPTANQPSTVQSQIPTVIKDSEDDAKESRVNSLKKGKEKVSKEDTRLKTRKKSSECPKTDEKEEKKTSPKNKKKDENRKSKKDKKKQGCCCCC